jgi:hypothetical protein
MHSRGKNMTQEPATLYKLIILYILNKANFPMTNSQIGNFILDKGFTDFLTLQQVIIALGEANLISSKTIGNRTLIDLTNDGANTLAFFSNRIPNAIKEDIHTFLSDNSIELKNEISILSNYYKTTAGNYEANLLAKEKNQVLFNLKLGVPTEALAISICENWAEKNESIYKYITKQLF